MEDTAFSDEFCHFIQTAIPAVDAAEFLLLLADKPAVSWTLPDALSRLRPAVNITDAEALRYVELFQAAGVVAVSPERQIQYRPAHEGLAQHVRTLAQAYEERPVTLIRMIYALRDTKIQSFADAFRLRKR